MEKIKSIFDELAKWQEENKENRGVILIAVEKKSEDEELAEAEATAAVIGSMKTCVMGVKSALQDVEPVRRIIRRAVVEDSMDALLKRMGGVCGKDKETPATGLRTARKPQNRAKNKYHTEEA